MRQKAKPAPATEGPRELQLQGSLPGLGDLPFVHVDIKLATEDSGQGETLRLQAHIETRFEALADALPAPLKAKALPGARKAGALIRKGLSAPLVQRAVTPFRDLKLNSWIDLQASTAPRDQGPRELLPQNQLARLGVSPQKDGPPVQTWLSETGGPTPGLAQITTVLLDKAQLPARLKAALGSRPFQLAATLVNVVEDGPGIPPKR